MRYVPSSEVTARLPAYSRLGALKTYSELHSDSVHTKCPRPITRTSCFHFCNIDETCAVPLIGYPGLCWSTCNDTAVGTTESKRIEFTLGFIISCLLSCCCCSYLGSYWTGDALSACATTALSRQSAMNWQLGNYEPRPCCRSSWALVCSALFCYSLVRWDLDRLRRRYGTEPWSWVRWYRVAGLVHVKKSNSTSQQELDAIRIEVYVRVK